MYIVCMYVLVSTFTCKYSYIMYTCAMSGRNMLNYFYVISSNILLNEHLTPKLSDFGLARECKNIPGARTTLSTSSAVVMGTMAYLAPEYLRNPKLSPTTDVYAFGVVMLELFTGQAADDSTRDIRALVGWVSIIVTCSNVFL